MKITKWIVSGYSWLFDILYWILTVLFYGNLVLCCFAVIFVMGELLLFLLDIGEVSLKEVVVALAVIGLEFVLWGILYLMDVVDEVLKWIR